MKKLYAFLLLCALALAPLGAQGPAARTEARIDQVWNQYDLTGSGVLAVVMDRGVDYTHPDFIAADGTTRIAYIYDLYDDSGANDPDNPYGTGTIYDATEINQSLQQGGTPLTNDIYGHGTATTGILAGNGRAITDTLLYRGVAPEATIISIIVTKDAVPPFGDYPGRAGQFDPNRLPTAFAFAKDKIAELGLPAVTLLNIGSIGNPTDGSTAFCDLVDDYVQSGHTFVCGVGDDGGRANHVIEQLAVNTTTTFEIEKATAGNLRFTAWYDEAARCQLTVERPNGTVAGPFAPPQGPNDSQDNTSLDQLRIFHRGANVEFAGASSDFRQLLVDISGPAGTYKIHLETTQLGTETTIHGMLNPSRIFNDNRFVNFSATGGNINEYASCPSTLSPTDYVANTSYVDVDGIPRNRTGEGAVGELWLGSSAGPTMDDRLGTDIAAPGELAVGAYSLDSYYGSFAFNTLQNSNGYYGIQNAVSGAAPIVAGVVALMLELNPTLTPEQIKTILQETARQDGFTGDTPNAAWGYGKMDALAAIDRVFQTVDTDEAVPPPAGGLAVQPNPFRGQVTLSFPAAGTAPFDVAVYSLAGRRVYTTRIAAGQSLDLSALPAGLYYLRARIAGRTVVSKIIKT
jgi:subtilisin family serine protease